LIFHNLLKYNLHFILTNSYIGGHVPKLEDHLLEEPILKLNVGVNETNDVGEVPLISLLDCYRKEERVGLARILLSIGADANTKSKDGVKPIHTELRRLLMLTW
jgi:hypothetical protein